MLRFPKAPSVSDEELAHPTLLTAGKVIVNVIARFRHDRTAAIVGSAFLSLMLWGSHGDLDLLGVFWGGWHGPGSNPATRGVIVSWIPWDQEWLSFWAGAVLVVGIPAMVIRFYLHEDIRDFGLRLPPSGRRRLALYGSLMLLAISVGPFYLASKDHAMRATYPLYHHFTGNLQFAIYELGYLPFFVAIEFIFRGYLLFGLFSRPAKTAADGTHRTRVVYGYDATLVAMLSYTAWHLGKPLPELWGTLVWGLAAGALALATQSILPIVLIHWLLNVFLDLVIWKRW